MTATTDSSFDKSTTATAVAAAFPESINSRTILITGVNKGGIGYGTAKAFASQKPRTIILAGRSQAKLDECADALKNEYPHLDIKLLILDLSSLKSARKAASEVLSWSDVPKIDLLICNAGRMVHGSDPDSKPDFSEDGIELVFATNHVGHFLFASLIMPKIIAAAKDAPAGSVRIVNVSSSGTYVSPFRASDLKWEKPATELPENERPQFAMMRTAGMTVEDDQAYIPTAAYGASKTCNILFSVGLTERLYKKHGILSIALNPGEVQSELARYTDPAWLDRMVKKRAEAGILFWKSLDQGASTSLVAACDPKLSVPEADGTGYFLNDCQIGKAPGYATDKVAAEKLWEISEDLTGKKFSW